MQHILVHSKMNGLRALLTAPPVFAFRQLRGDSKKCCRLLQAIFENHHEPIIDLQTWERVQELRKQRKRPNRYDDVGLFSGLLFCADCGHVMYQQRYQTDKRKQDCYICGSYKKRTADCTAHFIRTDLLTAGVLDNLRKLAAAAKQLEQNPAG